MQSGLGVHSYYYNFVGRETKTVFIMKKLFLAILVALLTFDQATAQAAYFPESTPLGNDNQKAGLFEDDLDDLQKRRRRKSRRGRGRGADMGLVISPQLMVGMPMGDLGESNKLGFGLTLDGSYYLDQIGFGASTGYHMFGWKDETGMTSGSQAFIPLLLQANYMLATDDFKPYVGLGVGLFVNSTSGELTAEVPIGMDPNTGEILYQTVTQDFTESGSDFGLSPFAGFYYNLNDQMHLTGGLHYNMIMTKVETVNANMTITEENLTLSYLTINVGIAISLQ